MRILLEYVVKGALQGIPGSEARAARDVFGKGDDFDASIDPEVRIQYGRLRRKLAEYYTTEGKEAALVIDLPARKYSPLFVAGRQSQDDQTAAIGFDDDLRNGRAPLAVAMEAGASGPSRSGSPLRPAADTDAAVQAIAVLPFTNLTNDPVHDVFCYGLTEEIITTLASEPAVNVVASNSAFQFKDKPVDVREVGQELGVVMILEGSVRMESDQTRITAKLARVNDGIAIWSDSFDATVDGAINTQQAMAQKIIESLPL